MDGMGTGGLTTLWDMDYEGGQSTVQSGNNGFVYKLYPNHKISERELQQYIELQNKYAEREYCFSLDGVINFEYEGRKVDKVKFEVLKLPENYTQASNKKNEETINVHEVPEIKGNSMFFSLSPAIVEALLDELCEQLNPLSYKFNDNIYDFNEHLHPANMKIVGIDKGELHIVITDISKDIRKAVGSKSDYPCAPDPFTLLRQSLAEKGLDLEEMFAKISQQINSIVDNPLDEVAVPKTEIIITKSEIITCLQNSNFPRSIHQGIAMYILQNKEKVLGSSLYNKHEQISISILEGGSVIIEEVEESLV